MMPTFYVVMFETADGLMVWDDPWDAYDNVPEAVEAANAMRASDRQVRANSVQSKIAVYRCEPVQEMGQ